MKKKIFTFIGSLFIGSMAFAQSNMTLLSHTAIPQYGGASGVIGATQQASDILAFRYNNTSYAAIGAYTGTVIFNINNPALPVQVAYVPNPDNSVNTWRDLEVWGNYLYVGQEYTSATGHAIIDLRTLGGTVSTTWWTPTFLENGANVTLSSSHTIWIDGGFLYMNRSGGTYIFDVRSSPTAPTYMGHAQPSGNYTHDCYTRNDTLYVSDIYGVGCEIYDVRNKTAPVFVASVPTPFAFNHNSWVSNSGTYLFTTDEKPDAPIAAYNIHDRSNIQEIGQFKRFPYTAGTVAHNIYCVANDFAVVAHYTDGIILLDTKYPDNMIEVGNYDTYPDPINTVHPYQGIWAVNCTLPNGNLVASDINTGLWIFQPTYNRASWLQGTTTDAANGNLLTNVDVRIRRSATDIAQTVSKTTGIYKTGHAQAGTCEVVFTKAGYYDETRTVNLVQNQITTLNVQMRRIVATETAALLDAKLLAQPNPFGESLNITYDFGTKNASNARLNVYNALGVLVESHALNATSGTISLGANLSSGVYMVCLAQNGAQSTAQRIVKQ
jgi:choice-of-anchor B domain-containing protein